jgi:phage tail tape-measure protein
MAGKASKVVEIEMRAKIAEAVKKFKEFSQETSKGLKQVKEEAAKTTKEFKETSDASHKTAASFGILKATIAALAGGWAAYRVLGIAKDFIGVASSVEDYEVRLRTLLGSQRAANEAMRFFNEVAAKSPATLQEVIEAGTTLTAMGADYKKWIPAIPSSG